MSDELPAASAATEPAPEVPAVTPAPEPVAPVAPPDGDQPSAFDEPVSTPPSEAVPVIEEKPVEPEVVPEPEPPAAPQIPRYTPAPVEAVKIATISVGDGGISIIPAEDGIAPIPVDVGFQRAHNPQPGQYCVVKNGNPVFTISAVEFEANFVPYKS